MNAPLPGSVWVARRNRLNHDWIKNRYIPTLEGYLNILRNGVRDPEIEESFFTEEFPRWHVYSLEAGTLLDLHEKDMSPSRYLHEGSDRWVRELLHSIWKSRYGIKKREGRARLAVEEANKTHRRLTDTHASHRSIPPEEIEAFLKNVREVATAFEGFPRQPELR